MQLGRLKAGEIVRVLPEGTVGGGQFFVVELVEKRRFWLVDAASELTVGDRVMIERSVAGDARYRGRCEAVSIVDSNIAFESLSEWKRVQARDFVRVAADRLPVEGILREDGESFGMIMLDLSTGGMQVETESDLQWGDQIDCRFTLPNCEVLFTIPAAVVRVIETPTSSQERKRERLGLQFVQLAGPIESEITRWVFREQIRRNNIKRGSDR